MARDQTWDTAGIVERREDVRGWRQPRKLFERALDIELDEPLSGGGRAHQSSSELLTGDTELLEPEDATPRSISTTLGEISPSGVEPSPQGFGKYEILGKVGAGGFGAVYKGRDPVLKRLVAIKTCSSGDKRLRERFFREGQIAAALQHPNITTVHDLGFEKGLPFLVQEFLNGEDLSQQIARREPLTTPNRIDYLLQVARGLAYAHRHGVLHRDVKPHNVRVLENGRLKILDFGIARLIEEQNPITTEGVALGTVGYLAPEQLEGGEIDQRADIFSFGVLAYELLTYKHPFTSATLSRTTYRLLHENPTPIGALWPECPVALEAIIDRCLAKDRQDRYPKLELVIGDLEALSQQLRSDSDKIETRAQLLARKRRRWLFSAATALLALTASFILWSSRSLPASSAVPGQDAASQSAYSEPAQERQPQPEPENQKAETATREPDTASGGGPSSPLSIPASHAGTDTTITTSRSGKEPARPSALTTTSPVDRGRSSPEPATSSTEVEPESEHGPPDPTLPIALEDMAMLAAHERAENNAQRADDPPTPQPIQPVTDDEEDGHEISRQGTDTTEPAPAHRIAPRLINHPQPRYPPRALSRRQEARLVIAVLVDAEGRVVRTLVKSNSNPGLGFAQAASEAAQQATFHPATENGIAGREWTEIPFVFSLEGL